jgi:hydroxyacyl-ACP dehydratase HTD2-like protein with hotdog domain
VTEGLASLEAVDAGTQLPDIYRTPQMIDLFLYGAATWVTHKIHYDVAHARSEGHADVVVHATLQEVYLTQVVREWAGRAARIRKLNYRNLAKAVVGEQLTIRGRILAVDLAEREVRCEVWIENAHGVRTCAGEAITVIADQ